MTSDLDEFMAEVRADSRTAGPAAEAALDAYSAHFQMARSVLEARRERGWSQSHLSRLAHVQQSEISRIEQGNGNPTINTMAQLGHVLGMRLAFIPIETTDKRKRSSGASKPLVSGTSQSGKKWMSSRKSAGKGGKNTPLRPAGPSAKPSRRARSRKMQVPSA